MAAVTVEVVLVVDQAVVGLVEAAALAAVVQAGIGDESEAFIQTFLYYTVASAPCIF
jgi:hypothetical protein